MAKREPSFEEAYTALEDVVRRLESGGLPLDQSITLFEEGMRLARICGRQLDVAELRIVQITAEAEEQPDSVEALQ
ncbi:MAG: exodeoxyribonuclease VII small subunit [Dehalococcoidia bacterium]|nr:exodeoxyribonuclease VII small subunit [Dehalococcoidia bacterium]